jgi:hypothetical protein
MMHFDADISQLEDCTPQKIRYFLDSLILINSLISTTENLRERVLYRNMLVRSKVKNSLPRLYQLGEAALDRQLDFFFEDMKYDSETMAQEFQFREHKEYKIFENEEENDIINSILSCVKFDQLTRKSHLKLVNSLVVDICYSQIASHLDLIYHKALPTFDTHFLADVFEKQTNLEWKEKFDESSRQRDLMEINFTEQTLKLKKENELKISLLEKDLVNLQSQLELESKNVKILEDKLTELNSKIQSYESHEHKRKESLISDIPFSYSANDNIKPIASQQEKQLNEGAFICPPESPTPPPLPPLPLCSISNFKKDSKAFLESKTFLKTPIIQNDGKGDSTTIVGIPPPPPPPPFSSIPIPPPPAFIKPAIVAERKRVPSCKMRQIAWKKVPESLIAGSIWEKINDIKWEEKLDFSNLEKNFAAKKEEEFKSKLEKKGFLSSKIQTNLGIVLNRIKCPPATCRQALKQMDMSIFDDQIISELLKIDLDKKSKEDLEKKLVEGEDWSGLPFAEQFLLCMYSLPFYEQRLKCWSLKNSFFEWFSDTRQVSHISDDLGVRAIFNRHESNFKKQIPSGAIGMHFGSWKLYESRNVSSECQGI